MRSQVNIVIKPDDYFYLFNRSLIETSYFTALLILKVDSSCEEERNLFAARLNIHQHRDSLPQQHRHTITNHQPILNYHYQTAN